MPLSSSGLGRLVLNQEITGSNPVRGTKYPKFNLWILGREGQDGELGEFRPAVQPAKPF